MFKLRAALCALVLSMGGGLRAQSVLALPGQLNSGGNVTAYSAASLTQTNNFVAGNSPFTALTLPGGTKTYVIGSSGSQAVTAVDSNFANPRTVANFSTQPVAAALTPDGSKLLVLAGALQILNTATDQIASGSPINLNSTPIDLAVSLDGTKAFVIGQGTSGSILSEVDLNQSRVIATLAVAGLATGVSAAPNGLIYVSTQNQILEVNPATLTTTPAGIIALNARPGKLVFTPDGQYALAVNLTPVTGSSVLMISLSSHVVVATVPPFGVTLNNLYVASSNLLYAYSQSTQSLYTIAIAGTTASPTLSINALTITALPMASITALVFSDEIGVANTNTLATRTLYVAEGTNLYKIDLNSSSITSRANNSSAIGALAYSNPFSPNVTPVSILSYGNGQVVAPGATSLPLVVQVLDANGRPVTGATVTFSATAGTLSTATVTTSSNGYATTTLTAPSGGGNTIVTATAAGLSAMFTVNYGSTGGSGTGAGGLTIISGQGQIVYEETTTGIGFGSPLTVQYNDANGNPISNATVTFTVVQGPGAIVGGAATAVPNQETAVTDQNGQASVQFQSTLLQSSGLGYNQTVITANAPNTNTETFYETTVQLLPAPRPPSVLLVTPASGGTISGGAGTVKKGAVQVQVVSTLGFPIPNVGIQLVNASNSGAAPSGTCVDSTGSGVLTDSTGTATCDVLFGGMLGTGQVYVNIGSFQQSPTFNVNVTTGPPAKVTIVGGNNQSGTPGKQLATALVGLVTDGVGDPLPGVPVSFSVSPASGATLSNASTVTDSNGRASVLVTPGNTAGPVRITLTAGTSATAVVSNTFSLTVTIPTAGIRAVSGGGQTTFTGTQFSSPLVVSVLDANGNPVSGAAVSFAVTSGSAVVGATTVTTGPTGQASTTITAGASAGPITVTASSGSFSTSFALTSVVPGPTNLAIVNGASFLSQISPGSIAAITGTGFATGITGTVTPNPYVGGPLPTSLSGVSVLFNGTAAPIFSVSNINGKQQINLQVPFELSPGPVTVTVNISGGGTSTFNATLSPYSPGIFETTYGGQRLGVAVRPDGSYVTPANPAHLGENITIYATGLGQVSPATATGDIGLNQSLVAPVVAGVNNAGVQLISAVYAQNLVGVYAITFMVPANSATGSAQPIGLIVYDPSNNSYFAQGTVLPISN